MNARKPVIALLVFAVLLGLYFLDSHRKELRRLEKEKEERLISFERDDIDAFSLKNKNGEFRLSKTDDKWLIEKPVETRASQDVIYTVLSNLAGAKKRNTFETEDVSQYGLDEPSAEITLRAPGKSATIHVGEASAYSGQVFAMVRGEKRVFTVSEHVANNLDKNLTELRDRTIARCAPDDMAAFILGTSKGVIQCEKKGEDWGISEPKRYRGDCVAIENFLREIDNSRAVDFVDTATLSTNLAPYGLDEPQISLTLIRNIPDEVTKTSETTLLVGRRDRGEGYFARRVGEPLIFSIPEELYGGLNKNLADFRDRNFFHTNMLDIGRVEIDAGESAVALIKNDQGDWQFENDPDTRVDQAEVNLAVSNVINRKASEWVTDQPGDLALYGLKPPKIEFVVESKDRSKSEGVLIGKKPQDRDIIYVQRVGEDTIWGMDWTRTHDFFKTSEDFIDKTLLPIETDKLARLEINDQGNELSLLRNEGQWFVKRSAKEKPRAIENFYAESLISALTSVKYDTEIDLTTSEQEQIELSNPAFQFFLYDANDKPIGELRCTRTIRRFVYAETAAKKIFRVKSENYSQLETALQELKDKVAEIEFF